ncbi:conserved hypothetical protein [Ricinus communis]|uniref:Aspartyl/asparaginy/proline hydroxylase domain-containing protein n=1 Tax=Ricinus communis TaxID=3988 RepID=B9TP39_RICCO|nr:conserved hypothetical protein [Ricinus communis]
MDACAASYLDSTGHFGGTWMTDVKHARRPILEELGWMPPNRELVARARNPNFRRGVFNNKAEPPAELVEFLKERGYKIGLESMLFANKHGVALHEDADWSVLWTLDVPMGPSPLHLIVGGKDIPMYRGQILLFNASRRHGVIATTQGLWSVYSAYVKRL